MNYTFLLFAFGLLAPFTGTGQNLLEKYQWRNRLVVVFSDNDSQTMAEQQINRLKKDQESLDERDLLYFWFSEEHAGGRSPGFSAQEVASLRERYNPEGKPFLLVLIGKDGGVKMTRHAAVEPREIFDLIDSMPMRRSEMKKNR